MTQMIRVWNQVSALSCLLCQPDLDPSLDNVSNSLGGDFPACCVRVSCAVLISSVFGVIIASRKTLP